VVQKGFLPGPGKLLNLKTREPHLSGVHRLQIMDYQEIVPPIVSDGLSRTSGTVDGSGRQITKVLYYTKSFR
jgi:hypothetical protein